VPGIFRRAFAFLALAALTTCGPTPPTAMDLYRQDQIRQGKVPVPAAEAALNCEPNLIARLPVELHGPLMTVPVSINGQALRLYVDSGAERTTISERAAARLHLPRDMGRIVTSTGIGGSTVSADGVVSDFTLGTVRLTPVQRVGIGKFSFDADPNPPADGLLGADVLLAFDLDIDVPGKALTIYSLHGCTNSRPRWQEPYEAIQGVTAQKDRLLIPFQLNGVSGRAILDTGASATTIGLRMAQRMGLTEEAMSLDRKIVQRGVGTGSVTAHYHWFREMRVGPAAIQGLMLSVLPTDAGVGDALIGQDFLAGRRVWLSFPTKQVFVSKLAHEMRTKP
jgi:predicted aspartyl protease